MTSVFRPEDSPYSMGQGDDTPAWQWAFSNAKAVHGVARTDIVGDFLVSNFDLTGGHSFKIEVPHGASFLAVLQTESPKVVFDFTGSSDIDCSGVRVRSREGTSNPPILALAAVLLAESSPGDSDNNTLRKCGSAGPFGAASLGIVGATQNGFNDCSWQQDDAGHPCYIISTNPDYGLISAFKPITQGASNVGGQFFKNTRLHGYRGQNNNSAGYFRNADNVHILGGVHDCSGDAHILFEGQCRKITISTKFYSESGYPANYLFKVPYADAACTDLCVINPNEADNAWAVARTSGNFPNFRVL